MIVLLKASLQAATATTWAPPPPTLFDQLEGAEIAGEFRVLSTTIVMVEDFPTMNVVLEPLRTVRGERGTVTVILPGEGAPDAFGVSAGETLFLMLEPAVGVPGFHNVAYGPHVGVFRRVEGRAADPQERAIVDLPCDGRPLRIAGHQALGLDWDDAMKALASCAGAR